MSTWYAVGRDAHKTAAAGEDWFHGSTYELPFDRFDLTKNRQHDYGNKHWNSHLGAHFTSEHHTAAQIGLEGNGHVYHVDLAAKNPKHYDSEFDLDREGHDWAESRGIVSQKDWKDGYEDTLRNHPRVKEIAAGFRDHLRSQGHDGITYGNEYEGSHKHTCAIAFHPDDITIAKRHYPDSRCEEGTVCSHCDWPLPKQTHGECENCGEHVDWHDQHSARPDDHAADGKVASLTNYPQPEEHGFYEYRPAPGEGGQGRRGLGDAGAGRRGAQARPRRVGAGLARDAAGGTGGDGAPGSLTPDPTWHSAATKDMKRLDGPVRKQMQTTIDKIIAGDPTTMAQTHPLTGVLKGWNATKGSRGHRVIHQPNAEGGIHIGYVGLHEYDKAIQRLTSRTTDPYDFVLQPKPYSQAVHREIHALYGGEKVGGIQWRVEDGDESQGVISNLTVHRAHQRQGIATELWNRARQITPNLQHSKMLSSDGRAWHATLPEDQQQRSKTAGAV